MKRRWWGGGGDRRDPFLSKIVYTVLTFGITLIFYYFLKTNIYSVCTKKILITYNKD